MAIIKMSSDEIKKVVTPERIRAEIEAARKLPFVYDPDCPPLTDEQLSRFRRVSAPRRGTA